jgi:hypothetical protein
MIVKDNTQVSLRIGGIPYPMTNTTFEDVCTVQNACTILPTCRLILNDTTNFFSSIDLSDGCPISIAMGRSKNDKTYKAFDYILTDVSSIDISNGKQYVIYGILNNFKWLRVKPHKAYTGTSSIVAKQIATECGFTSTNIDSTDDSQVWMTSNLSYGQFAQYLSDRAYVDENSMIMTSVDENSIFYYKNITTIPESFPKPYTYFYQVKPDSSAKSNYRVTGISHSKDIGIANQMYGYDYNLINPRLSGLTKMSNKVNFKKNYSNKLEINESNLNMGNVRTEYCPPDCGNNHDFYNQAFYKNKRQRAFYSSDTIIQCEEYCSVNLFDIVRCEDTEIGGINPTEDVYFVVTGKTRMVTNKLAYVEQYVLTSTGKNTSNSSLR